MSTEFSMPLEATCSESLCLNTVLLTPHRSILILRPPIKMSRVTATKVSSATAAHAGNLALDILSNFMHRRRKL